MSKRKIFNDPIYGFISFPFDLIYDLIDHPLFQRLRRITQLGLSSYVYPGATHTRFHHAIGAAYLCHSLITMLKSKDITISAEEHEACIIAALLHDIGHGPFSHALEYQLIDLHHEELTLRIIHKLNTEYEGRLSLAIAIFEKSYYKKYLSQIISSQIDVDRMDYLNRDSFYSGVAEGKIGYERIIKMMNVADNQLVIEEKGIHSVEKFLLSRYFMYRQVYLHKTSIAVEQMLKGFISRYRTLYNEQGFRSLAALDQTLNYDNSQEKQLNNFLKLDDSDIICLLKTSLDSEDSILRYLAKGILERKLHKTRFSKTAFNKEQLGQIVQKVTSDQNFNNQLENMLIFIGKEDYSIYSKNDEIKFVSKSSKQLINLSDLTELALNYSVNRDYFIVYPSKTYASLS